MRIRLQLFSFLRECAPPDAKHGEAVVSFPDFPQATLADLIARLGLDRRLNVSAGDFVKETSCQVMLNGCAQRDMQKELSDDDRVEIFPPVAGG
jgi:molybdopterin converting factor small subunit